MNDDLEVMWRVVRAVVDAGGLPPAALCDIEIQVSPPSLEMRDQKQEAEVHQIEYQNGILSPQTWCRRRGLDYDQEQMNLAQHNQRPQEVQGPELSGPIVRAIEGAHTPDATREQELLEFVRAITEAGWDPSKHPRGDNPQNRGEFSSAGGGGASAPSRSLGPHAGAGDGAQPHVLTVGHETPQPASGDRAAPSGNIYLAQNPRDRAERDRISKGLDAITGKDGADAEKPVLGERDWKSKGGRRTFKGTFLRLSEDGKSVILKPSADDADQKNRKVPINDLSADDQALVKGLQALPKNVTLDADGLMEKNKQTWKEAVIRDFGRLSELPGGKELLDDIKTSNNGHGIRIAPRGADQDNSVTFQGDMTRGSDATVHYDPTDTQGYKVDGGRGDATRPPYLALGKELHTGQRAQVGRASSNTMEEEIDAGNFENELRDQHNKALKPGERRLPHRDVPKQ